MQNSAWRSVARFTLFILVGLMACGCGLRGPVLSLSAGTDAPRLVVLEGLNRSELASFSDRDEKTRQGVIKVRVAEAPGDAPAIWGDCVRRDEQIVFVPRYPFQPGLKYRARFDPAGLGMSGGAVGLEFMIPAPPPEPVVNVSAVYPSADELPENLLKFYIHFSGPMSRGAAYQHIRLLDENGKIVPSPFLELGEELWNPEMTRFTLFFEPGRVKQGLAPRLELGPALVKGKSYTLQIDAEWRDAENRPLAAPLRKHFKATAAEMGRIDTSKWVIAAPAAGSSGEIVVKFEKPLDHAMLGRAITVVEGEGKVVAGKVGILDRERRWSFKPSSPWLAGRYYLSVITILEDVAGNSVGRAFEVDLNQGAAEEEKGLFRIPLDIGASK